MELCGTEVKIAYNLLVQMWLDVSERTLVGTAMTYSNKAELQT